MNASAWFTVSDGKKFTDHVRMRLISQLINGISRVIQKLLKYFNDSIISTSFIPQAPVWAVIFCLNLHKMLSPGKSSIAPAAVKAGLPL